MSPEKPSLLRPLVLVVLVLVAYALVGVVAGIVWERVWTPPAEIVQQHQPYYVDYGSLRRVFTGTGLYVLVGGVASAVVSLVVSLLSRRRELFTLLAVVLGSTTAALLMWKVGVHVGPADPKAAAATAADNTLLPGSLAVSGRSPYLIWPMTSLFVLALVFFAWPGARPADPDPPAGEPHHTEAQVTDAPRG
ncbi:MAG: hypothetical protein WB797_14310 [Nocardioides sp.]